MKEILNFVFSRGARGEKGKIKNVKMFGNGVVLYVIVTFVVFK